jgi:putative restriction endonuclease
MIDFLALLIASDIQLNLLKNKTVLYKINNKTFTLIDSLEIIPSKDSFTHEDNKLGKGKGAWEWHIGSKKDDSRHEFFGGLNFNVNCFLKRSDLNWLMDELKPEYMLPSQEYRGKNRFVELWRERVAEINRLNEYPFFTFSEHNKRAINDQRLYAKRPGNVGIGDDIYGLMRKLTLPNLTFVSILKLEALDGEILFYFKIFPEYTDERIETPNETQLIREIENSVLISVTEKTQLIKARIGQGIFRTKLLDDCKFCPITGINDSRILIASHIKPWRVSDNHDRLYVKNGLLFTPTYDKLFDNGFITFDLEKRIIISPWISQENRVRLNISNEQNFPLLQTTGREEFLEFHKNSVFKI